MKKTPLILPALLLSFCVLGGSQDLKGPAAKNAKPWQEAEKGKIALSALNKEDLKGPAAKNTKTWLKADVELQAIQTGPLQLQGPAAKNRKPWNR